MMESEEQWSCRDFTQIKPRRPEGPADEEWEEEEASTFSFLWSTAGGGGEEELEAVHGRDHEHEKNMAAEMQEEFEFSSCGMAAATPTTPANVVERFLSPSGISPADELFFKGQLLPLHLPPRIQMVKKLSLEKQQQQQQEQEQQQQNNVEASLGETSQFRNVHRNEEIIARVNALMQARFARLFQPKYSSKYCINTATEVVSSAAATPCASWWDPRGSSHENTSSAASFTSTDRDSTSDSASSRDSSGSSQDCFDSKGADHFHSTDSKGSTFLHNREVFSTHSTHPGERAGGISTWLRPPFKWKVLFGAKKTVPAKPYDISMEPKAHSMESKAAHYMEAPPEFFSASPISTDRYYSDCSGELTPSGNLHLSSRAFIHGGDMEKYSRGMERARGYLQRYMKALNPSRGKDHNSDEVGAPAAAARASPAISTSRSFPPFSQSFRISPKDISLKMKRPPAPPSPLQAGPRRVSTSSASSELHSAIQGAIAHCKESQKQSLRQDSDVQLQSSK